MNQNHLPKVRVERIEIFRRTKSMSTIIVEDGIEPVFLESLGRLPVYEIRDGKRVRCEGETIMFEQVPEGEGK